MAVGHSVYSDASLNNLKNCRRLGGVTPIWWTLDHWACDVYETVVPCPAASRLIPLEFTAEAVRFVGSSDQSLTRIAKDLGAADHTLRNWVQHPEIKDGG